MSQNTILNISEWKFLLSKRISLKGFWSHVTLFHCFGVKMPAGSACLSCRPLVSVHMLIFTGHSRKWCWQLRFEVRKESGVKHFLLTWKPVQSAPFSWYLSSAPSDHLHLHDLGLFGPKQKPRVNYLWRCNDFRATADLHLVSKWGPENRLCFRHIMAVLSPTCFHLGVSAMPLGLTRLEPIPASNAGEPSRFTLPYLDS